ncbi:gliding motility-associated C-terminal domain-containing protein [Pedobacter sp. UYP30]|uniref:T9SS type B sorting domain-containing protein n=1 Tax=Pedobacter sp. UYP30 TaxID=1756400 RepID=UPI0033934B45
MTKWRWNKRHLDIKRYRKLSKYFGKIFNRLGALVFESLNYQTPFDGKVKGVDLPNGVYFYILKISA